MIKNNKFFDKLFYKFTKTYYYSALLFPKDVREDVAVLYAFVRIPDEYVDNPVTDPKQSLMSFWGEFDKAWKNGGSDDFVIDSFVRLAHRRKIKKAVADSFLESMKMDLAISTYKTYTDLQKYTYGSAEVIGVMMSDIMEVEKKGYVYARKLGLAMQLTNFLRDVKEDWQRGRIYIPLEDLKKFEIGVDEWGSVDSQKFDKLMLFEIARVRKIFAEARKGIKYIPEDCQRAVLMATSLYEVVLDKIAKNPAAILVNKPKVSFQDRLRVMRQK